MLKKYRTWYEAEKEKCGNLWINSNRLFVTWNGSPMHPDTVTDWFRSFIEKNNLPKILSMVLGTQMLLCLYLKM